MSIVGVNLPPQRWYLPEDLREALRKKVSVYEGGYRAVGHRIGISGASLHRLLTGQASSSKALPALCELFDVELVDYLPLTEEQLSWLRLLADAKRSGKDPAALEAAVRALTGLHKSAT